MNPSHLVLVGVGGFLGAIARYAVSQALQGLLGARWPLGTFVINVTGCFAIGFVLTLIGERVLAHDAWRYLVPIGFIGAYTTFSTYAWEATQLVDEGAWLRAGAYVVLSSAAGFAAVWAASAAARRL